MKNIATAAAAARPAAARQKPTLRHSPRGASRSTGFAGALGELGLPPGTRLLSLLGFNLGVELGQLAVVGVLLPLLYVLRLRPWYARAAMPVLSLGIGAVAVSWVWQRVMA